MKRLDLIIDALEMVLISSECDTYLQALAAARALRELKPVAWLDEELGLAYTVEELADTDGTCFEPLYALGDEK